MYSIEGASKGIDLYEVCAATATRPGFLELLESGTPSKLYSIRPQKRDAPSELYMIARIPPQNCTQLGCPVGSRLPQTQAEYPSHVAELCSELTRTYHVIIGRIR